MKRACLMMSLCAASAFADVAVPQRNALSGAGATRVVLSAKQAAKCGGPSERRYVTPSAANVRRLDAALPRALEDIASRSTSDPRARDVYRRLGSDVRFYLGTPDGHIEVLGFCAEWAKGDSCPPVIEDGGDCVWYIRFDVKLGTFDQFDTNGEA